MSRAAQLPRAHVVVRRVVVSAPLVRDVRTEGGPGRRVAVPVPGLPRDVLRGPSARVVDGARQVRSVPSARADAPETSVVHFMFAVVSRLRVGARSREGRRGRQHRGRHLRSRGHGHDVGPRAGGQGRHRRFQAARGGARGTPHGRPIGLGPVAGGRPEAPRRGVKEEAPRHFGGVPALPRARRLCSEARRRGCRGRVARSPL
mmetsp:Transcript_15157/g.46871  ORF Transcript_15157/g.46871 Transcript_15157/m.46871 type:complete len:203 (+) Transcript_15157:2929-3537(+)